MEYGIEWSWFERDNGIESMLGELQAIPAWQLVHSVRYYVGRTDCPHSPFDDGTIKFEANENWDFNRLKTFFTQKFNFNTNRSVIALMGAHTVGKGHNFINRNNINVNNNCCGGNDFVGKWKARPSHVFTNEYYMDMYFILWRQISSNTHINGSTIHNVNGNNLQFKHPISTRSPHEGLMLNIDFSLIFMPGLGVTNFSTGQVSCNVWNSGCGPECDCPNENGGFSKTQDCAIHVPQPHCDTFRDPINDNLDRYFESYHLFDTGFYRDFGMVYERMIQINNNELTYVEKPRPLFTFAGYKNTKNADPQLLMEELTVGWYADLNHMQIWGLNANCEIEWFNNSMVTMNGLNFNPYQGQFNPNSAYVGVYVSRDYNAGSETYDTYIWLGSGVANNEHLLNIMQNITELMHTWWDESLDQVDTGYDMRIMTEAVIMNQGSEDATFLSRFGKTLSYTNNEWTPNCADKTVPWELEPWVSNNINSATAAPTQDIPTTTPSGTPTSSPIERIPSTSPTNIPSKTPSISPSKGNMLFDGPNQSQSCVHISLLFCIVFTVFVLFLS